VRPAGAWLDGDGDAEEPDDARHEEPPEWRVLARHRLSGGWADYGRHRRDVAEGMASGWRGRGWEVEVRDERAQRPLWAEIEPAREPPRMVRGERVARERVWVELPGQGRLWRER
jgi:hypothetical protein